MFLQKKLLEKFSMLSIFYIYRYLLVFFAGLQRLRGETRELAGLLPWRHREAPRVRDVIVQRDAGPLPLGRGRRGESVRSAVGLHGAFRGSAVRVGAVCPDRPQLSSGRSGPI